jgi:dienelactone hydrolase
MLANRILPFLLFAGLLAACNQSKNPGQTGGDDATASADSANLAPEIRYQPVIYMHDSMTMTSVAAYNVNAKGTLPIVLIIPEWWGVNEYVGRRAREVADLGYFAMVVDMYGGAQKAADPKEAQALATPFYQNPALGRQRVEAALRKARTFPQVDTSRTAAIGYCFGGSMALNAARQGVPFDGVVSFHGGLEGPPPVATTRNTQMLVLHGAADAMVPAEQVAAFRQQMDAAGVRYAIKEYPGATHAFTNPDATETGKKFNLPIEYNEAADKASWEEMKSFLKGLFGK